MSRADVQRTTQIFFSLYFTMTGLHALHMIVGIVILFVIAVDGAQGPVRRASGTRRSR